MKVRLFIPKAIHRHRQLLVDVVNTVHLQHAIVGATGYQISRPPTVIFIGLAWRPVKSFHWIPADSAQRAGMGTNASLGNKIIYLCQRQPSSPVQLSPELSSSRQDQVLLHTEKTPLNSNFLPLGKPTVHAIRQPAAAPP